MRKRNKAVYVRFSDDEYEQLQDKISETGQTLQSFIINAALNAKISSSGEVEQMKSKNKVLADFDKQLRGIGTNINQMAHIANGYGMMPEIKELMELKAEVHEMRMEVNKEWQSTRQSISQQKLTEQ